MIGALALVLLVATPVTSGAVASSSACLHFEPTEEAITGTLIQRTLPGPPNYEDIAGGDQPETSLFIRLAPPICVSGAPTSELNAEDVADISLVQLVVSGKKFKQYQGLVGRRVTAVGSLFAAQSGHHRTEVLLTVSRLTEAH